MNNLDYGLVSVKITEFEKKIMDGVSDYPTAAKISILSFTSILKSVFEILSGKSMDDVLQNFELDILPQILASDKDLQSELVFLKSATQLSRSQIAEIKESLEKQFGKKLFILTEIDKRLVAGIVVQYKGQVLDMSVKTKIESTL